MCTCPEYFKKQQTLYKQKEGTALLMSSQVLFCFLKMVQQLSSLQPSVFRSLFKELPSIKCLLQFFKICTSKAFVTSRDQIRLSLFFCMLLTFLLLDFNQWRFAQCYQYSDHICQLSTTVTLTWAGGKGGTLQTLELLRWLAHIRK